MKLCSLTVTSRTREGIIADALKSVIDWVDGCVILELDTGSDRTIEVAKEIAGGKLHLYTIPFDAAEQDCAALRNHLLALAKDLGYDWAVMLDTDERIELNGMDIRIFLEHTQHEVICVANDAGNYHKERFFRIPCAYRWVGLVHEYLDMPGKLHYTPRVIRFRELVKTPELYKSGQERMLPLLLDQVRLDSRNPRWRMYLGYVLSAMGKDAEAIDQFKCAAELSEDGGAAAWALTLAANIHAENEEYYQSRSTALEAMKCAPYIAEAQCAAAHACLMLGDTLSAQTWAHFAILNGRTQPGGVTRQGYCDPRALFEAPYEILAEVFRVEGKQKESAQASALAAKARTQRIKFCVHGEE